MYRLIYIISFLIRQFLLPNPFAPLGGNAEIINLLVGGAFVPLSYFMTGFIYDKGSEPAIGSILFLVVYAINTGVTYLVCLAYPLEWLMILIGAAYFAIFVILSVIIRKNRI